jgi:ankyrin repeat protein
VGHGDDHGLEVIGWASFWEGCDDDAHRAVVDFLVSRGAKHHIFSAISLNLPGEVRRIVAASPGALNSRLTRNDNHQTPLHHAVSKNRPQMVALLLELGGDALAVDGTGESVASYATTPDIDRPVMAVIREMTLDELGSAEGGSREANLQVRDLVAALVLEDWPLAERLIAADAHLVNGGALHLMAKRNALMAAQWLLGHGANVNEVVRHWGASTTALHLAIWWNHPDMVRLLHDAGADATIRDSMHDGNAFDWADHFARPELRRILEGG